MVQSNTAAVFIGLSVGGLIMYFIQEMMKKKTKSEKQANKETKTKKTAIEQEVETENEPVVNMSTNENDLKVIRVYFGTQTGSSEKFAHKFKEMTLSREKGLTVIVKNMENFDPDEFVTDSSQGFHIFIMSTYTDGEPPESAKWFSKWLQESSNDFRVQKSLLSNMKYAVFGLGHSLYSDYYCTAAKNVDRWLHKLSAVRVCPFTDGDEYSPNSAHGSQGKDFEVWANDMLSLVEDINNDKINMKPTTEKKTEEEQEAESDDNEDDNKENEELVDVEEMGDFIAQYGDKLNKNNSSSVIKRATKKNKEPVEMITPELRKALGKQGYKLIGSHSGVKLCRWTKSMLRGRGGCYKHTFYGIESHRCMETTPSLACANKCVFCWRHHTNPVGTEWRWKQDPAHVIVDGAISNHYAMIKQFKGVPGVKPERFAEGFSIQHCALSLVGEPIMYPEINEFLKLIHEKGISSFLVTNAQFPQAIRDLLPCTQLYVSVDAATQESLKKIDRPLFKDFWPRFIESLKALSEKGQRTVYRLTVVKSWNSEEIESYANLVELGKPDFIEVKGVTYCGDNKSNGGLTMKNVPWHDEVLGFVRQLASLLPEYEVASEHEHSNCVLLANTKFRDPMEEGGNWNTWINYEKFHELYQRYVATGELFATEDYMAPTPYWAQIGSKERGFDPQETRWHRKMKPSQGC